MTNGQRNNTDKTYSRLPSLSHPKEMVHPDSQLERGRQDLKPLPGQAWASLVSAVLHSRLSIFELILINGHSHKQIPTRAPTSPTQSPTMVRQGMPGVASSPHTDPLHPPRTSAT